MKEKRCFVYEVDDGHGPFYWEVMTDAVSDPLRGEILKIWPNALHVTDPWPLAKKLSDAGWSVTVDSQAAYSEWLYDYHNPEE